MSDKKFRPEISDIDVSVEQYDEIILGFPIWWYVAPTIMNTFLESYNFSGKKIVLFATSGGSGFGNTVSELKLSAPDAVIIEGKVFHKAAANLNPGLLSVASTFARIPAAFSAARSSSAFSITPSLRCWIGMITVCTGAILGGRTSPLLSP